MTKPILDGKGRVIGREVSGVMLDGKGHNVARFNQSSNRTLDGKGKNVGVGNQTIRQLGK
jgi:hypothetical protein